MKPDPEQLMSMILRWKNAVDQIADIEGLHPTFVLNTIPASSHRVAASNGVGNVWGLENETSPFISKDRKSVV